MDGIVIYPSNIDLRTINCACGDPKCKIGLSFDTKGEDNNITVLRLHDKYSNEHHMELNAETANNLISDLLPVIGHEQWREPARHNYYDYRWRIAKNERPAPGQKILWKYYQRIDWGVYDPRINGKLLETNDPREPVNWALRVHGTDHERIHWSNVNCWIPYPIGWEYLGQEKN